MTTKEKRLISKAVEELGGARQIHKELLEYTRRVERMENQRAQLIEQYPDKWIAMADSEIVAVADSIEAILKDLDERGIRRADAVVEFMDTNPRSMIL